MAAAYHGHHATQSGSGYQGAAQQACLHDLQDQLARLSATVTLLKLQVARLCSDSVTRASATHEVAEAEEGKSSHSLQTVTTLGIEGRG